MTTSVSENNYRWVIVSASALILAVAMGSIVNGMSAYIVPMQDVYGWSRGDLAMINMIGILGLAFGGMIFGRVADRLGAQKVVSFGAVVLGLSYVTAYFAVELWQYYLLMFIAGFFGAGAIFPPVMAMVGRWFTIGTGMAIGIASAGQALGQGGVPFVSSFLIKSYNVDVAFGLTGIFMLATLVPLSMLLRPPPQTGLSPSQVKAVECSGYLPTKTVITQMSLATIFCCTCMSVPLMHLVPLIQDRGFAPEQAGSVIFVMLLVGILGRLIFGKLADVIGGLPAYMLATGWMTLMVFGFIYVSSLSGFFIYSAIYGFGYAGVMTGVLVSVTMLTPPSNRATAMGIVSMFAWFGHAIGGYQGGVFYDFSGDYTGAYAVAAIAGVLNLIIVGDLYRKSRGGGRGIAVLA